MVASRGPNKGYNYFSGLSDSEIARYQKEALTGHRPTWTVGVNWYLRSNFKLMLDYTRVDSERRGIEDNPGIVGARAQFYW